MNLFKEKENGLCSCINQVKNKKDNAKGNVM